MATWKKVLTEDDGNLATTDLTQTAATDRVYTLAADAASSVEFKATGGTGIKVDNAGTDYVAITTVQGCRILDTNTTQAGKLQLREGTDNGTNYVSIQCADDLGNTQLYTFPTAYPSSNGQILSSTTAGQWSWVDDKNIGDTNLVCTGNRTLDLSSGGRLSIRENDADLVAQFEEGAVTLAGAVKIVEDGDATQGEIRLSEGGPSDGYVGLKAYTTVNTSYTLTFPGNGPTGTNLLKVDSGGQIGYQAIPTSYDLRVEDDGVQIYDTPGSINFTGSGVTVTNPSGSEVEVAISGGGGGTPGGSDGQIQYNDGGSFGGDSAFTFIDGSEKSVHSTGVFYAQRIAVEEAQITASTAGAFGRGSRVLYKTGILGTIAGGRIYYNNNGTAAQAGNGSQAAASQMLFVGTDDASGDELLLEGFIRLASNTNFSSGASGRPVYLGSSGDATITVPTGVRRVIGYVWDASDSIIYFSPDNTWIV